MTKTSVFAKFVAKPGQRDDVVLALEKMLPAVAAESGTEVFTFHLDGGEPDTVWVFELYTDADALTEHASSEAMGGLINDLMSLVAEPPQMNVATYASGAGLAT